MKTVYFVRHGETIHNATERFNTPDSPLSEKGEQQAIEIARRCESLPIELLVASTYKRAQQTAATVAKAIGKTVESSGLFIEGKYTSKLDGQLVNDPTVGPIVEEYFKNFGKPEYRFEDGETFDDLKKRALDALHFLEVRKEDNILVISHAFFMWIIAAAAVFGDDLTAEECKGVIAGFDLMENTGLSVIHQRSLSKKVVGEPMSKWQLRVWNDHAHLG